MSRARDAGEALYAASGSEIVKLHCRIGFDIWNPILVELLGGLVRDRPDGPWREPEADCEAARALTAWMS